jgi:hypothetical protein
MPAAASSTQRKCESLRLPSTATASGPRNSSVTASPSGMRSSER